MESGASICPEDVKYPANLGSVVASVSSSAQVPPRRIRGLDADQRRAQRHESLLDAALELFTTRGYQNTSIELLCQSASVSTKSFYKLFDSREDCFLALYDRTARQYRDHIGAALAEAPDDETSVTRHLLRAYVDMLAADPRKAQVTFGSARIITPATERARYDNRRWAAEFIEQVWRRYGIEGDRHRIATAVVGGMFDVIADWLVHLHAGPVDTAETHALVDDLTDFYTAVRRGLTPIDTGTAS